MTLVDQLKQAGFRLGGSRRMAEKYPDRVIVSDLADWDFYCDDTQANRDFLTANGFHLVQADNRDYWDDLLVDMYKHASQPVEVLVRKDVELYSRSFESIPCDDFVHGLWKSSPHVSQPLHMPTFRAGVCDYFNRLFKANHELAA